MALLDLFVNARRWSANMSVCKTRSPNPRDETREEGKETHQKTRNGDTQAPRQDEIDEQWRPNDADDAGDTGPAS